MFSTTGRTFSQPTGPMHQHREGHRRHFPEGLRKRTRRHKESEKDKNPQGLRRKSGIRKNFGKGANPQGLQGKTEAILQQRRSVHKGLRRKENHFPSSGKKRKRHRDFQKGILQSGEYHDQDEGKAENTATAGRRNRDLFAIRGASYTKRRKPPTN
ncbi:hypothetical protein TcasGA2_TC031946 [Tribolium castaneum]|uniref:Uncharacterized protein n=1 Tax=Tribolium castaneum TaxID=7070 RepID=A0A139W9T8_TRICA|nr:hypothetical protein TcasGA2_TC031946 [Tribolium castaneum]